jgi:hypothetical protein
MTGVVTVARRAARPGVMRFDGTGRCLAFEE